MGPRGLTTSITLIGNPGSGKSFYGRFLANRWGVPMYSASKILRKDVASKASMDTGELLDDEVTSSLLLCFLREENDSRFFMMDGFPRTLTQVELMFTTWPKSLHIESALHLDIPDSVCAQKIAGRRECSICNREPNSAYVKSDGFDLPPMRPSICANRCTPQLHWKQRLDDASEDTVRNRLESYRLLTSPIIEYYKEAGELVSLTPYNGDKDLPEIERRLDAWIAEKNERNKTAVCSET